jgi:RNA polymerase sigma-70 factor (ECF subfamily)
VYDAYSPRLYRFLMRMSKRREIAEDLLEETWLRLVSVSARLDPETRLEPWLFAVARNLFVSYCRSREREQSYASELLAVWPDEVRRSPLEDAISREFEHRVETALAAIPLKYREAVLLVAEEGLRPIDAAAICGITAEAFRQRLSRARAMLGESIKLEEEIP